MQIKIRKTYNKLLIEKETEKIKPYKIELKEKTELPNGHTFLLLSCQVLFFSILVPKESFLWHLVR